MPISNGIARAKFCGSCHMTLELTETGGGALGCQQHWQRLYGQNLGRVGPEKAPSEQTMSMQRLCIGNLIQGY